jgi:subtilisin family serine protease
MIRRGRLMLVLVTGEARSHVPCRIDRLLGAALPATTMRDPRIDAILNGDEDFTVTAVYHARSSFGRVGEQHADYDDLEESLGLSRPYSVELADQDRAADVVRQLRELPNVESASLQTLAIAPFAVAVDPAPTIADPLAPHKQVHAPEAHALEAGDSEVWVGLVDTGISLPHPEFRRKLLAGYDTVHLGVGSDFGDVRLVGNSHGDDFAPRDEVGHGSHVGGIVGAHGWRLPTGVAGRSMMLPVRVLAAARDHKSGKLVGVGSLPDINAGLKVAVDMGADVLNLSFGTPASAVPEGPPPHRDVIDYAAQNGCTLVAAMGNSGLHETYYPAAYPEVIAVGSVDDSGHRSHFSTTGDHIAISAPGERIVSAGRHGYEAGSGTSYAAPFVTGAAALLLSRARRRNRKLNGTEVKKLLMESAHPVDGGGFTSETGSGVLDIVAALGRLDTALDSVSPPGAPR